MKKFIVILVFIFSFILLKELLAIENDSYDEVVKTIEFDNLHSSKLNYILKDLDIYIVEVTIKVNNELITYEVNTLINNDIEKELTNRLYKYLISINKREEASILKVKGYKVESIKLRCNKVQYNTIISRSELNE